MNIGIRMSYYWILAMHFWVDNFKGKRAFWPSRKPVKSNKRMKARIFPIIFLPTSVVGRLSFCLVLGYFGTTFFVLSATIKNEKDVELNSTKSNEKVGPFSCQAELSVFFSAVAILFFVSPFSLCLLLIMALAHLLFPFRWPTLKLENYERWILFCAIFVIAILSINCNG